MHIGNLSGIHIHISKSRSILHNTEGLNCGLRHMFYVSYSFFFFWKIELRIFSVTINVYRECRIKQELSPGFYRIIFCFKHSLKNCRGNRDRRQIYLRSIKQDLFSTYGIKNTHRTIGVDC